MYLSHFSLNERPFTISPDPRFLFMSHRYREALAHLTYGVSEGGGFVLLTGEVGTGKTTVCRCLLQQLPDNTNLAFVLNPKLNSVELLATICDELDIPYPDGCSSLKFLTDKISNYLLKCYEKDLNVVVMIDEAQNLQTEVLEQIRLLTNLETNQKKLLQIILVGQPELQEKLAQRELRQLAQRITARYHLRPLNIKETIAYVLHRVKIAGCDRALFTRQSIEYLHKKTQGIPRLVNTICDRALFAAASRQKDQVDHKIMAQAVTEVMGEPLDSSQDSQQSPLDSLVDHLKSNWKPAAIGGAAMLLVFLGFKAGQQESKGVLSSQSNVANAAQQTVIQGNRQLSANQSLSAVNQESLVSQLMGDQRWDNNGNWSMQSLLSLWQIDYSPLRDGDSCDFASTYGLKCSHHQGHWQLLREYNRPAILKFSAGLQGAFWGTLKSLNGLEAEMIFGEKMTRISLDKLSTLWTGDFMLLWQSPQGFEEALKIGDAGEAVEWLSKNLIQLSERRGEEPALQQSNLFNSELKKMLIAYQTQRNINADGIAGMQTILKINTENLPGIPLLSLN